MNSHNTQTNYGQVANMLHFLDYSTKSELQLAIDKVTAASKDTRTSSNNRRIAKNVLSLLKKEMKEYA